jgi:uncharacterized protein (DUF2235 family)
MVFAGLRAWFEEVGMGKRVVLCADGTWNTPHGLGAAVNDTNVLLLPFDLVATQYF